MNVPEIPGGVAALATIQAAQLSAAIQAAIAWRRASGWLGRDQDLTQAAQLLVVTKGPTRPAPVFARWHAEFASRLADALGRRYQDQTVGHRCLLCLLLTNALIRMPDMAPVYLRLLAGGLP